MIGFSDFLGRSLLNKLCFFGRQSAIFKHWSFHLEIQKTQYYKSLLKKCENLGQWKPHSWIFLQWVNKSITGMSKMNSNKSDLESDCVKSPKNVTKKPFKKYLIFLWKRILLIFRDDFWQSIKKFLITCFFN